MGAYDNPKIIQPVNYGEIYAKAAMNVASSYDFYVKKQEEKRKEREAKIAASEKAVREFGKEALTITEGALGASVFEAAEQMTRQFAILEQQKMSGEISGAEYNEGYMELFGNISKIKGVNTALAPVEEELRSGNTSKYNPRSLELIGLIDAKNRGALNVRVVAGETIYDYNDPKGNLITVSEKELAQADNVYINQVYDTAPDVELGEKLINSFIEKDGSSRMVKNDDGSTTTIATERYKSGVPLDEKERIEFFRNTLENGSKSPYSGMDIMEAGSVINDKILDEPLDKDSRAYIQALDTLKDKKGNLDEVTKQNIEAALTGENPGLPAFVLDSKGKRVPLDNFGISFAKKYLTDEILKVSGRLAQAKQQVVVDQTTKDDSNSGGRGSSGYGMTTDELAYIDTFIKPLLTEKKFNDAALEIIKRTTDDIAVVNKETNFLEIFELDEEGKKQKTATYNLIKEADIERFFKDYYGTEKQANAANFNKAAPYVKDLIEDYFGKKRVNQGAKTETAAKQESSKINREFASPSKTVN